MYIFIIYLFAGVRVAEEWRKRKTKQKQKQERASERTWLSPLLGANTGGHWVCFFSFKQALDGAICPLTEI